MWRNPGVWTIEKYQLLKSRPENLSRLARFMHLKIDGMSAGQIARLIYWRITREDYVTRMYF